MDRARPAAYTVNPSAPHSDTPDEQAAAAVRFQQTLACAEKKRPEDRAPALLDTLAILHTLPQAVMPVALRHIATIAQDLPEKHAVITTDVLLTHYPAMIADYGQDTASHAAQSVAETLMHCAADRPQHYQVQLLCKLAGVAAQSGVPLFAHFITGQLEAMLIQPHCSDPAALIDAAAMLTQQQPVSQQLDALKVLYRLANEQKTHRLAALEALQAQSGRLPLTLRTLDFLQTLTQEISRLRRGQI